MTPILTRIYNSPGGPEVLDTLMKYLYKGMAGPAQQQALKGSKSGLTPQHTGLGRGGSEGGGAAMSVFLSWHEKVVDVAGLGSVGRVMSDRRKV
jgi:actin related protein 2/3 complex subunit 5